MLSRLGGWVESWLDRSEPWTNVYGLARTLLAASTAATLLATPMKALFHPVVGVSAVPACTDGLARLGLFCTMAPAHFEAMRWIAVLVLLVVASGWRPRVTAVPHWWISASLVMNGSLIEGGDQAAMALSLLLLPVALTDRRKWHWDPPPPRGHGVLEDARRLAAMVAYALVRLQVAIIYFHASTGKLPVAEWQDGTVLYYWLLHPTFGAPRWLEPLVRALVLDGTIVSLLTWGVIALEYLLAAALFMPKRRWKYLLASGFALHAGIILVHGLVSFGVIMFGALILFLRPWEQSFRFALPRLPRLDLASSWLRGVRRRRTS